MYGRARTGRLQDFSEVEKARRGCGRVAPLLLMQLGGMGSAESSPIEITNAFQFDA